MEEAPTRRHSTRQGRYALTFGGSKYAYQEAPDGPVVERLLDVVYQPIKTPDGITTGVFVVGVDMTGRTQAQAGA